MAKDLEEIERCHAEWLRINAEYVALMQDHDYPINERIHLLKEKGEELGKAFNNYMRATAR